MGAYLDTPITDKNPENGSNDMAHWGVCSMQGWRCGMEDSHIAVSIDLPKSKTKGMLFGVFDGHGGKEVAVFAEEHFKKTLENTPEFQAENYEVALKKAFLKLDSEVQKQDYACDTGTTACVVLVTPQMIYCSNAGDSRGVLSRDNKAVPLSEDHKPDNEDELRRIQKANHHVEDSRVDGNLALSRAFGDFQYKDNNQLGPEAQAVTANPDLTKQERTKKDQFIVLACDGIWDCVTNEECVKKMSDFQAKPGINNNNLANCVEKLFEEILAPNTDEGIGTDNMTCILIRLDNSGVKKDS